MSQGKSLNRQSPVRACVSETLEQRRMLSTTIVDDGFGNLTLDNDNDGHVITLYATKHVMYFYEDGVVLNSYSQHYVKSLEVNLNGGDDRIVCDTWQFLNLNNKIGATINGGDGDDVIPGTWATDVLNGGEGNDTFRPTLGNDTVWGEGGNDIFVGTADSQEWHGGDGVDTIDFYTSLSNTVSVSLDDIANDYNRGGYDNVGSDIENIITGNGGDSIIANGADNIIVSNGGNDTIYAGDGNDLIEDGLGTDRVYCEAGNDMVFSTTNASTAGNKDSIYGGDGDDYFFGFTDGSKDFIDGGNGNDTLEGTDALDVLTGIESVI